MITLLVRIQKLATAFLLLSIPPILLATETNQNNTSSTGLFFYALSRGNSVTSKLLQTNPLNVLHFPANPALLGSLERGLHSPSIKQVRHMMYRGLEGGKSEAKRRKERTSERASERDRVFKR
jgi:hypothetical protein